MTPRSLQRLFRRYVGIGPKWVLSRYRLQDAAAAIDAGEATDLATLAADLGWFDQAHFSRDFREVVGVTPSQYLAQAQASSR
jgi:AraC-like DNA-binding protein